VFCLRSRPTHPGLILQRESVQTVDFHPDRVQLSTNSVTARAFFHSAKYLAIGMAPMTNISPNSVW
jgi:hypothetical protein